MPRNGSGGYTPPSNSFNPAINGAAATAADWNATLSDIAAAIQQSVSADGQTPITGNLNLGGNKLANMGAGTAAGNSLRFEQLFSQGALTDIASAATTDIGAVLSNFLRVTGTTGITSFGANYNGPKFLIFSGAVLLTHSATLVLPGASNITTAANDALIAVPISGGWQVVAYTRASGIAATAGPLASSGITGAAASGANSDITSLTALSSITLQHPGEICFFARNTAPAGFLKANGAAVSRTTYAALFAAIGTTFGSGDGSTTFALPDLRGEFLRGWSDGRGVDSGRAFGSAQAQDIQPHTHTINPVSIQSGGGVGGDNNLVQNGGGAWATGSTGTTETRPRNIALLACIKF